MSLVKNAKTGLWESYLRTERFGRLHLSMATPRKDEATTREAALIQLVREGDPHLVDELRRRKITIEEVARLYRTRKPFEELKSGTQWPLFGAACDEYLAWVEAHPRRAKNTLIQATHYLGRARGFFGDRTETKPDGSEWWMGLGTRVDRITGDDVRAFAAQLAAAGLSPWSVALGLQRVAAVFHWLAKEEVRRAAEEKRTPRYLHNPVDREMIPERVETRARFLSEAEATRLIAAAPDALRFPILAGIMAGLRIGEVVTLRTPPHDIDLDNGLIVIQERAGWRPKSKHSRREIPIAKEFRPVVEHHLATYASDRWMLPTPRDGASPLTKHALMMQFARVVRDADLVAGRADPMGVTFHTLRHTFASWLVMRGVDLFTVAKLMGHGSIDMVVRTYGHLSPNHKAIAAGHLGAWLASVTPIVSFTEDPADA